MRVHFLKDTYVTCIVESQCIQGWPPLFYWHFVNAIAYPVSVQNSGKIRQGKIAGTSHLNYDILLFHDLKGHEHLQFYVGIFSRPTPKLLLSCPNLWIPCWNWYAIWPSLLICDWGTCLWFQCRHMSVMVSENSTIFQQFVKTSENSKSPHYWECTSDRWPAASD